MPVQEAQTGNKRLDKFLNRGNQRVYRDRREGVRHLNLGVCGHDNGGNMLSSIVRDWTQKGAQEETPAWSRLASNFEKEWIQNFKRNQNIMDKDGAQMVPLGRPDHKGIREGETAYILGNGPSIKTNGHLLIGKTRNIFGCNRIGDLWEYGIHPEFYCAIDAGAAEPTIAKWGSQICDNTIGVFSVFVNPGIAKKWGKSWWFNVWGRGSKLWRLCSRYAWKRWKSNFRALDSGYNVIYSLTHLAYVMGYKRIVFTGCDYAYSGGYEYFTDKTPKILLGKPGEWHFEKDFRKRRLKHGLMQYPDVLGNNTWTTNAMMMTARHLAAACYYLASEIEIVNCSENGVFMGPGIKQGRLADYV